MSEPTAEQIERQEVLETLKRQAVALATRLGDAYEQAWFAGGEIPSDPACQRIAPILRRANRRARRRDRASYAYYCTYTD